MSDSSIDDPSELLPRHSLLETQRAVFKAIMNPLSSEQRARHNCDSGASMDSIAEEFMIPNDRLSAFERLEIYNRQYWFRLIDCIYDDFPGLRSLLGEDRFYPLVETYLKRHPSNSYTLRNLGSKMVQFLIEEPIHAGKRAAIALEMARFEWAQIEAFDGAACDPLNLANLANVNPDTLKMRLQPYISLLKLSYPLDDFVMAIRKASSQRSEAASEQAPEKAGRPIALPKKQKVFLVVHRLDNSLYYKRLDEAAFELLLRLQGGMALGAACEEVIKYFPKSVIKNNSPATQIQEWFSVWSSLNWFCAD